MSGILTPNSACPNTVNQNYKQALQQAHRKLRDGRPQDCIRLCNQLLRQAPGEASALNLRAMAQQRAGDLAAAADSFRAAMKAAPQDLSLQLAYASCLRQGGQLAPAEEQLRKTTAQTPGNAQAWYGLARVLYDRKRWTDALEVARKAAALAPGMPQIHELAAAIAQKQGDTALATELCREGLRHNPKAPRLHYSLAQLLREGAEFSAAADAYEEARLLGFDAPDLYRNRAEALLDSGDITAALHCAEAGADRFPGHPPLQRSAARLHFSAGADGDPLARLRRAVHEQPANPALWQTLIELMKRLGEGDKVAATLADAGARGCPRTPGLAVLEALDRGQRGESAAAVAALEGLANAHPGDRYVQHSLAMELLRSGDAERAEERCALWLESAPFDQTLLAYRGTALQMLGDPRESWLLDYERMVVPVEVQAPASHGRREDYFRELAATIEGLHHSHAQPIAQSVRGGTQTNGFLFRLKDSILATLEEQLRIAVASAVENFPDDPAHPFWGRGGRSVAPEALRWGGAWSVRLRDQGFHANHIHPEGWISSALYIALPDEVEQSAGNEGSIQFGAPMTELGVSLAPRRFVKPTVGTLVLFPSYMWHGTVPFQSEQPRITVAFDLLPLTGRNS